MAVGRVLNVGMLLGLGASLALTLPRLWQPGAAEPRQEPEARPPIAIPVPPPAPPPSLGPQVPPLAVNARLSEACLERLRQANPFHDQGPVSVSITIGISGRVKHVGLTPRGRKSPPLIPCVREEVGRWTFPPSDEEHGLELPVLRSIQPRAASALLRGLHLGELCGTSRPEKNPR